MFFFFFFKQKTAYEILRSDWSSDVCSSDLCRVEGPITGPVEQVNVSGDPDLTPPASVPMSAEEAASGAIDSSQNTSSGANETTTGDETTTSDETTSDQSDGESAAQ